MHLRVRARLARGGGVSAHQGAGQWAPQLKPVHVSTMYGGSALPAPRNQWPSAASSVTPFVVMVEKRGVSVLQCL